MDAAFIREAIAYLKERAGRITESMNSNEQKGPAVKIGENPPVHLTYCLNVHPGETWEENFEAIRTVTLQIRDRVAPHRPFGLGLRLGRLAADQLPIWKYCINSARFLKNKDLYVFTINGFPYGEFHKAPVKENVYRPDWRSSKRVLLYQPACRYPFKPPAGRDIGQYQHGARILQGMDQDRLRPYLNDSNLMECVAHLGDIRVKTGKEIRLALEPEPDCFLETTEETVTFFTRICMGRGDNILPA